MKRSKPMKRTPLKRTPLNPISDKTRARNAEYKIVRDKYIRAHPVCEGRLDKFPCGRDATDVHHVAARSVRPDLVCDPSNFLALCRMCHSRVETEEGWWDGYHKRHAWEAD